MNDKMKNLLRTLLIYLCIVALTLVLNHFYDRSQTQSYIEEYKALKGSQLLNEISDTYKLTVEQHSNYRLNKEMKRKLVDRLNYLRSELHKVDQQINKGNVDHPIEFSFIDHDIKLVNLALSDSTKDDIIPVIVLHSMEGLGELKKEITYIQYR
ncbi:hypothetical protein SAMN05444487_11189 [Marininema mesophilum]|uniref:Uncharacterized protein n=1 Tax=Marininema mesophilum TaxID=1048340 RepID=A0A1H2ZJ27_9BACL|nr:hypothetical protein [Marininema mesophilum]SDX17375.1 hypothetical protein SAMN05444487_11189 [Marininema mesophilum]